MESVQGGGGDWAEWKNLVLKLLEDNKKMMEVVDSKLQELNVEVALLKRDVSARAAVWGALPAAIAALIWYFNR